MILSKYEFQSQQASCLMEGGGGEGPPPRPFPRIPPRTVTKRVPKVWTQHNFAGTQVLVLRHQVWAAPKKTCFESTSPPLVKSKITVVYRVELRDWWFFFNFTLLPIWQEGKLVLRVFLLFQNINQVTQFSSCTNLLTFFSGCLSQHCLAHRRHNHFVKRKNCDIRLRGTGIGW